MSQALNRTSPKLQPTHSSKAKKVNVRGVESPKKTFLFLQLQTCKNAYFRIWKNPVSSILSCLLIGIALSFPLFLLVLIENGASMGENWQGRPGVSVYMNQTAGVRSESTWRSIFKESSLVSDVVFVSDSEGLELFQKSMGLEGIIKQLGKNPIPAMAQVKLVEGVSIESLDEFVKQLKAMPGVDDVKVDRIWVQRLDAIMNFFEKITSMLVAVFSLGVVLVIYNTIRLTIENRKDEIRIISLLGGTRMYTAMPFIYMGVWYGLMGAVLSQVMVAVMVTMMNYEIAALMSLYNSEMVVSYAGFSLVLMTVVIGSVLGAFGAFVSCQRQFRKLLPR